MNIFLNAIFDEDSICSFKGRIGRKLFLTNILFFNFFVLSFIYLAKAFLAYRFLMPLIIIVLLPVGICFCAGIVRRFHDLNMTGWWVFLMLAVEILFIQNIYNSQFMPKDLFLAVLMIKIILNVYVSVSEGSKGSNRYGKQPVKMGVKCSLKS